MAASHREQIIDLLDCNGEMHSSEIFASMSEVKKSTVKKELGILKKGGEVVTPRGRSWYRLPTDTSTPAQTRLNKELNQISEALRSADDNKNTIDKLMNLYDKHIERYAQWFEKSVDDDTDFQEPLQFIENFKGLTAIGDKLMKRWSLEHVGYDTNTRQAQEDAKAKTAEREKAEIEGAPLKDKVVIVGKYDPKAEKLLDMIPSSLKEMTEEKTEEAKV